MVFIISIAAIDRISQLKIIYQTNGFYVSHTTGKVEKQLHLISQTQSTLIRKRLFLLE